MLKTLTSLDPLSLGLNVAGLLANMLSPFTRTLTLYDQEKYLQNAKNAANAKGLIEKVVTSIVDNTNNGAKIFQGVPFYRSAVLRFGIDERSRMCDHPIEDGSTITDHKVKEPITFSCALAMPEFLGGMVVDELNDYYRDSKKIIVHCETGIYKNMILCEKPTNITPQNAARPIFDLKFREVVIVKPVLIWDDDSVDDPADSDTKKKTVLSDFLTENSTVAQILGKIAAI